MFTAAAVAVRILVNPLSNVFQKQLISEKVSHSFVNFFTYFCLSLFSIVFALQVHWAEFPGVFWYLALLTGVFTALGNRFLLLALQHGELSVLGPINSYKSLVSMVGAFLLFGELPGVGGCGGICLIIGGSYFIFDSVHERFSWTLVKRKDIQYRLAAMVITAMEAVIIKKIILLSSPAIALTTWCWFGAIFSFPLLFVQRTREVQTELRSASGQVAKLFAMVLCVGFMQLSTNYVFSVIPVAYALALFQLSAIISVFFGAHFFDEARLIRKLTGTGFMIAGSILIIFSA
jgi:drug/metabolite transporter (DMT)-like permease